MAVSFELFIEFDSSIPSEEQRARRDLLRLAFPVFGLEPINLHQVTAN